MFERILVAYDGSGGARAALAFASDLASKLGAGIASVSVEEHLPRYAASLSEVEGARERIEAHFRELTKQARDGAAVEGLELEAMVRQGSPVEEILRAARTGTFDLLALGSHGHSRVVERIVGSTSLSIARLAPCSVLVVRMSDEGAPRPGPIGQIVVGIDGSPLGRLALRAAMDLAILCDAAVTGVTVRETTPLAPPGATDLRYVEQQKVAAEEYARSAGVAFDHVTLRGHAAKALRDHARAGRADLLVLGATGLEHPWSPTIGGTASRVVGEAGCSVLLIRSPQAVRHVRDVMARAVSSVTADAPLGDVVELLLRRDVKAVPVIDHHRHVVGIVTGGDLLTRGQVGLRLSVTRDLDAETLGRQLRALRDSRIAAGTVMTRHVRTIRAEEDLASAMTAMASRNVKRLPVVNDRKELVGILSRADVLRAIAALPEPSEQPDHHPLPAWAQTVADAATTDVPRVSRDAPGEEVLRRVLESPLRRVVVEADGRVVGLVSDRDLVARSAPETRPWLLRMLGRQGSRPRAEAAPRSGRLTAEGLMAPSLISVRPADTLAHAVRLMMQHGVKRLVVVDDAGRFRGLVDRREILRLLAERAGA